VIYEVKIEMYGIKP